MIKLKILTGKDIRQVVTMAQAISSVKEAFLQLSTGKSILPLRTQVPVEGRDGVILFMSAYLSTSDALGAKIVSVFPRNVKQNLPTIHALVVLVNPETGEPAAVMDGTHLTALRTGAASGVATDLLARNEASVVAIIGAGIQGRTQLEAVCTVRAIKKAWIYDRLPEAAMAYAKEMKDCGDPIPTDISVADSAAQAVREADILCTATTSSEPVFEDGDLKPGVHINGIGSFTPEMQEIPSQTVVRSKVIVDSRSASMAEAGDLIIPLKEGLINEEHIHGEIGEIAVGKIAARESEDEIIFFKSVGLAVQDVAVGELIQRQAEQLGLGKEVEI
jgi:ornithine cyclodeaminase